MFGYIYKLKTKPRGFLSSSLIKLFSYKKGSLDILINIILMPFGVTFTMRFLGMHTEYSG